MRLVNRSYTQVKVKVSEGLGGGSRHSGPRCQCPHVRLAATDDELGGDIDNPTEA